jgi:hypothetical protein
MPQDQEAAATRRERTRDAAAALLEDFEHMRAVIAAPAMDRADARRLSAVLRRWLLEDDLRAVAAPRVGRIKIPASDLSQAYVAIARAKNVRAFYAVEGSFNGVGPHSILVNDPGTVAPSFRTPASEFAVDRFRDQNTMYLDGRWASRRDLIRYVANEKSGVHSDNERTLPHAIKDTIRRAEVMAEFDFSRPIIEFKFKDAPAFGPQSTYQKGRLSLALLLIISSAAALCRSADLQRLADYIRAELAEYI